MDLHCNTASSESSESFNTKNFMVFDFVISWLMSSKMSKGVALHGCNAIPVDVILGLLAI